MAETPTVQPWENLNAQYLIKQVREKKFIDPLVCTAVAREEHDRKTILQSQLTAAELQKLAAEINIQRSTLPETEQKALEDFQKQLEEKAKSKESASNGSLENDVISEAELKQEEANKGFFDRILDAVKNPLIARTIGQISNMLRKLGTGVLKMFGLENPDDKIAFFGVLYNEFFAETDVREHLQAVLPKKADWHLSLMKGRNDAQAIKDLIAEWKEAGCKPDALTIFAEKKAASFREENKVEIESRINAQPADRRAAFTIPITLTALVGKKKLGAAVASAETPATAS